MPKSFDIPPLTIVPAAGILPLDGISSCRKQLVGPSFPGSSLSTWRREPESAVECPLRLLCCKTGKRFLLRPGFRYSLDMLRWSRFVCLIRGWCIGSVVVSRIPDTQLVEDDNDPGKPLYIYNIHSKHVARLCKLS